MVNKDAEYWKNKGDKFSKTKNYEEAIKCYAKSAQINPDNAYIFYLWGNALSDLAGIKQDESLYLKAFEKYKKATEKNTDDANVLVFWGKALAGLAKIKQDKTLYQEAFEKYDRAVQLKPDNTFPLLLWGLALTDLAEIKKDKTIYHKAETIYHESIEKIKKAEQLEPNNTFVINLWGYALAALAEIKKDETIYREAFEKYEKASQLDPNDRFSYSFWGEALASFAEFKQDKNVIKILFDEFYQKSDNLKKLKKDILEIFIIFNNKNMKEIIDDKKIFFPLLEKDLENDDSNFFHEITKGIKDTEKLIKYKMAYISSVFIISQLHIKNKNEKSVAYYTKKTVSQAMLFNDVAFRLNAINYSNDPTEGKILLDYLFGEGKYPAKELNTGYGTFAGCFTFNHNSLNQFRLYGKENDKEGSGLSLVFKNTFFSEEAKMAMKQNNVSVEDKKQALFRCIYIDPVTQLVETVGHKEKYLFYREKNESEEDKNIEEEIEEYRIYITDIIESVKHEMEELHKLVEELEPEVIGQLLINLRYLTKHIAFKEEQECRIIKIHPLNDKEKVKINPAPADEKNIQIDNIKQLYIDYQNITGYVEKIYFGPKSTNMELFQDLLRYKNQNILCEKSKNPLS